MWTTLALCLLTSPAPQGQTAPNFAGYPEQDAQSYRLKLSVDPAAKRIEGTVQYEFLAVEPIEAILLDSTPSDEYSIRFVSAKGEKLATTQRKDQLRVALGRKAEKGELIVFTAILDGTPPDGFFFKRSRYGDDLAFTDHYSIRARGWLPCEDHPSDRAHFHTSLSFPAGNRALVSGATAASHSPQKDQVLLKSQTQSEIAPYLYAIVVGPYKEVVEKGDARLRPHLVYAQDVDKALKGLRFHGKWMGLMESTFGAYPYAEYATVQCPTRWGGFEAPGNVQLNEALFDGKDQGKSILAHELVHMWFGDAVGYAEWHEVWLSEGFASYFGPWLVAQTGGQALTESMKSMRTRWLRSRDGRTKSIRWDGFKHPDLALNANTYPKGAWVLHMLRGELGDAVFFTALKDYFTQFSGQSILTHDFVASIEASTGRQFGIFFDQWLDRKGCPELKVSLRDGVIAIEQMQPGESYRFPLRIRYTDSEGKEHREQLVVKEAITLHPTKGKASSVLLDPNTELLFRQR